MFYESMHLVCTSSILFLYVVQVHIFDFLTKLNIFVPYTCFYSNSHTYKLLIFDLSHHYLKYTECLYMHRLSSNCKFNILYFPLDNG